MFGEDRNWIKIITDDMVDYPRGAILELVPYKGNNVYRLEGLCDLRYIKGETDGRGMVWVVEHESNPTEETFAAVYVDPPTLPDEETDWGEVNETLDKVIDPPHYSCKDTLGVEVWDILDFFFPDDPHKWLCGKYLLRAGKKTDETEVRDLQKLIQYAQRRIAVVEREEAAA